MNKQVFCKNIIAFTDFILLFLSLSIALFLLHLWGGDVYDYLPSEQINDRIFIHLLLSALCVVWFWIRLRHYTYRKPFWFELKEILRTLLIFSVIELAVLAFS